MRNKKSLANAMAAKNDEFYTQLYDIEREMTAYLEYDPDVFCDKVILLPCDDPEWSFFTKWFALHFERLGIKKVISTSYAAASKPSNIPYNPTDFEITSANYDENKSKVCGKIFILDRDINNDGKINIEDLRWEYLEGDGDFRSEEVTKLRDEADIIITNPPFSLFREFLDWIIVANKKFSIIGNMNAISYKSVFPLIQTNKIWLGVASGSITYITPNGSEKKMGNTLWFTNMEHGRRHEPLILMSYRENELYNKKKLPNGYQRYDNYDAIEVPYTISIPADYSGEMGVPISFLEKYCPEQFEIIGSCRTLPCKKPNSDRVLGNSFYLNGEELYYRLVIKHRR